MPQPSDQPAPFASAEKLLQRLSGATRAGGAVHECRRRAHHLHAARKREIALALAQRRARQGSATSDDEHAVSTVIAGPCRPST